MAVSGSLFECFFEVVDGGGEDYLSEFVGPRAGVESGAESTFDGRKGSLGYPACAV